MTKQQIKDQIDFDITDKTTVNSITPTLVGDNIKNIIDFLPNLIMSYEGDIDSSTTLTFSDEILNVYKVTENFTFRSIPLKIGNIVGINEDLLIMLSKNQENFVKSVNTFLPDLTGNVTIPNASLTEAGIITNTTTADIQKIKGRKRFVGANQGVDQNSVSILDVRSADETQSYFAVRESGWIYLTGNMYTNKILDFTVDSPNAGSSYVGRIRRSSDKLVIGEQTNTPNSITVDLNTGNTTVGSNGGLASTNAQFQVFAQSSLKVSIPYPIMTNAQREAITGTNLIEGGMVYVSDNSPNKGLWIYKGTDVTYGGWKKLAEV